MEVDLFLTLLAEIIFGQPLTRARAGDLLPNILADPVLDVLINMMFVIHRLYYWPE